MYMIARFMSFYKPGVTESKDVEDERLDLTARRSSWFDFHIFRRTSGMIVQAIESIISYKNFLPSARVIRGNDPLETMLR